MRAYPLTLLVVWITGAFGAYLYSSTREIPPAVALPFGAALLVELSLYAALAFEPVRRWAARQRGLLVWLPLSAAIPYLVYTLPTGLLGRLSLFSLAALAVAVTVWYRRLPAHPLADLGFLALMAAPVLAKLFPRLYPAPVAELDEVAVLGQLMWIRLGIFAALELRRFEGTGFGFMPDAGAWRIGALYYACFMPVGAALAAGIGFARFEPAADWWWRFPLTFFGALWVVALSEEFFFRGMLQQILSGWWGTKAGLVAASLAFGAAHLGFRDFPNWEFAALASVAGLFYGRAYLAGGGVRAAMVAHALVVATWRTLFR